MTTNPKFDFNDLFDESDILNDYYFKGKKRQPKKPTPPTPVPVPSASPTSNVSTARRTIPPPLTISTTQPGSPPASTPTALTPAASTPPASTPTASTPTASTAPKPQINPITIRQDIWPNRISQPSTATMKIYSKPPK